MFTTVKKFSVLTALLVLLLPMSVCAETLTIPGTGDGTSILAAVGAAFSKQNPDIEIAVPKSIGSGGGVKAAGKGDAIVARVARGIKAKEEHFGLSYRPYARIPAVFFTSNDINIKHLSSAQVCDIYSGAIKNWKEVGGPDLPIRVVRREDGDSTLSALKKSFPGFDQVTITESALLAKKTPEMFALMGDHDHAIGFGPYDVAKNADVHIINIDGRAPTFPDYPSFTTLGFVYKDENLSATARMFLDFASSKGAELPIKVAGGLPMQ